MKTTTFPAPTLSQFDADDDETKSHAVKTVARYVMDGRTFLSFEEAIESRENRIETIVRPELRKTLPAKLALEDGFIVWMLNNRAELRKLLDY